MVAGGGVCVDGRRLLGGGVRSVNSEHSEQRLRVPPASTAGESQFGRRVRGKLNEQAGTAGGSIGR
jgi:hypothetical protein